MSSAYIVTYMNEDQLQSIYDNQKAINYFVDIRSVCPNFFDEKTMKFVVNDQESLELYIKKSLFNFMKYVDYHIGLAIKYKLVPRFFFFSDVGESVFHKQINKDYKANRTQSFVILTEEEYKRSKMLVNGLLEAFGKILDYIPGCYHIHLHYLETDFIPYYVISKFAFQDNEIFVIKSRDKDLAQCLSLKPYSYQLLMDRKQGKVLLDRQSVIEFHFNKQLKQGNLPPQLTSLFLAIAGDSSDNVIGVKGIGYKKVYSLLNSVSIKWELDNFVNLHRLIAYDDSLLEKKQDKTTLKLIKEHKDHIIQNLKLVDFKYLTDNLPSQFIQEINKELKKILELKIDSTYIKQFVQEMKDYFGPDVYFYHIVKYLDSLSHYAS